MTTLPMNKGSKIPIKIKQIKTVVLEDFLGQGGQALVWRVHDAESRQQYTLKIILNLIPNSINLKRVRQEAEVIIPSDYIVKPIGLNKWDSTTFLILFEYYPARSLKRLLQETVLTSTQKRRIFEQILQGTWDAHLHNVIHRDLKPDNILVGQDNRVKLIDFGIAKFKGTTKTQTGEFMGTLEYMAPELLEQGARVADPCSDIFSLGQILYELAMGWGFWQRKGFKSLQYPNYLVYLNQNPSPTEIMNVTNFSCDFYDNAAEVVMKAAKINPMKRYQNVAEMMLALGYKVTLPPKPVIDPDRRMPMLTVKTGDNKGEQTILDIPNNGSITIGRQADINLPYNTISRKHLEIRRSGQSYFGCDVGSTNGTLLRGIALLPNTPAVEIYPGDHLRLGDVFLQFTFMGETKKSGG